MHTRNNTNPLSDWQSVAKKGRYVVLALGLGLTSLKAEADANGTVTGQIVNADTQEPLRNAIVTIVGTTNSATAETGGFYTLLAVPSGHITLEVSYAGLETTQIAVDVAPGDLVMQDLSLKGARQVATNGAPAAPQVVDRLGSAKSLMEQKSSFNPRRVISTEALGNVSEGNVGEFLKFLPGVSVDYVEADIRSIRIRGFDPKYSSVTMDGLPIASAGSSNISTNRAFEFEQLSISSISTVDLTKAPLASTFSNGMSGNTNLLSKSAFDYSGRHASVSVSGVFNEYYDGIKNTPFLDGKDRFETRPNFSAEYSDTYLKGKLGVFASVSQADSVTAQKAFTTSYRLNADPTDNATELPRIVGFVLRDGPKLTVRKNYSARIDYKFSDRLSTWLRIDFNEYVGLIRNRDMTLTMAAAADTAASYNSIVNGVNSTTVTAGVPYTALSQTTVSGSASIATGMFRKSGDTLNVTSVTRYRYENLNAEASLGYSKATNRYDDLTEGYFNSVSASTTTPFSFRWDRSSASSTDVKVTQLTGNDWRDQSLWRITQTGATNFAQTSTPNRAQDIRKTAKLDFRYPYTLAKLSMNARWGGSLARAVRDNQRISRSFRYVGADGVAGTADDSPSVYLSTVGMQYDMGGNLDGLLYPDPFKLAAAYGANPGWYIENRPGEVSSRLLNTVKIKESVHAGYFENNIKIGKTLEVTPGLRWERTASGGTSYKDIGRNAAMTAIGLLPTQPDSAFTSNQTTNIAYLNARYGTPLNNGNSYDNVLGYLHSAYRLPKDWMLRASVHQSINRPDLANLVPQVIWTGESATSNATGVTANNPDLRPEQARTVNVSVEHYFKSVGFFSAGVFRSDIDDIQTRETVVLGSGGLYGDTSYAGWTVTRPINGAKAHISGAEVDYSHELSFLPGALSGLGVFANATVLRFDRDTNFLGSPSKVVNVGVSYSYKALSLAVRANWTGTRLNSDTRTVTGTNAARREYTADRLMIDANASYNITKKIALFTSVRNLLNEEATTYVSRKENILRVAKLGATYTFGVKASF